MVGMAFMVSVLEKAQMADAKFKNQMSLYGKESKSTFYSDLTIAECCGEDAIKDTYKNVIKSWLDNIEMISEFYIALNWKIWELYESNEPLAKLYDSLWDDCYIKITEHYKDNKEALRYFYDFVD